MPQLRETRQVAGNVEETFAYTADFTNIAEWDPGVTESRRLDSGPLDVGSRFELMVRFGSRLSPMIYEITAFESPHRVVLVGTGKQLTAVDDIRFAAIDGGTEIDYRADLQFKGLLRLIAPVLGSSLQKVGEKALDGLAAVRGSISVE